MKSKVYFKKPIYLVLLASLIASVLAFLFYGTTKLENKFEQKILEVSTNDIIEITNNTGQSVLNKIKDKKNCVKDIIIDEDLQQKLEGMISVLLTKNIKYAYILYKDKRDIFRFLADASPPVDKAFVNQKFDIQSPEWLQIYDTKKPVFIKQSLLKQLSITYLYPIVKEGEVKLILAIDFSINKVEDVNEILELMKKAILAIIIIILVFILILIFQTISYLIVQKSVYIDKLTGVYNRNYLQEYQEFINIGEYVIVASDIDHFKKINDTYGHDIGDKILKDIGSSIKKSVRQKDDIVIRYGGEEFLLLIRTKRDCNLDALDVIDRVFKNIKNSSYDIGNNSFLNVTISMGVNLTPKRSRTFQDAFKLADIALYNAKQKGRNQIEIYNENEQHDSSHLSINEIKEAIDEKRLICYFQKIVNTKSKETSHYEALLRIRGKDGNIITPDKILPIVKGTFISRNITKRVLSICIEQLKQNPDISINVNLNPQDIINDSILNRLKEYANEDNSISSRLGLEVIESEDIASYDGATKNILELKSLGYKIFIDDFGSGYSNFIYLTQVDTDYIKIDGAIIKNILDDSTSYLVVKSIVSFAKEAGIKTIAEYVKDEATYEKIKELGIDYSQGFLFSRPLDEIIK